MEKGKVHNLHSISQIRSSSSEHLISLLIRLVPVRENVILLILLKPPLELATLFQP
jgi:hypothetical protein